MHSGLGVEDEKGRGKGGKHLVEMLKNWGFSTKTIDPCWALKCSSSENPQVRRQRLVWLWQIPRLTRKTPTWVGATRVSRGWEWRGGRKLAQVVAATLLDYLCAFSRLQTVRDYMRIVFCLAAQRRLLSAAALELHDDQFGRRERGERGR